MPVVANAQTDVTDSLPAPLLREADHAADFFAKIGRGGRPLPPAKFIALISGSIREGADGVKKLAFVAWAAELGYREGLDRGVRIEAARKAAAA